MATPITNDNFSAKTPQSSLSHAKSQNASDLSHQTQAAVKTPETASTRPSSDSIEISQARTQPEAMTNRHAVTSQDQAESLVAKLKDMFAQNPEAAFNAQTSLANTNSLALLTMPPG